MKLKETWQALKERNAPLAAALNALARALNGFQAGPGVTLERNAAGGWNIGLTSQSSPRARGGIDTDTTWPGFEEVNVASYDTLAVDVFHLGVLVSKTAEIGEDSHYWLEIDQAAAGTGESSAEKVASVMAIVGGSAFPAISAKLIYPLIAIDGSTGTASRYCFIDTATANDRRLRFASVTAPDDPIGTLKIWEPAANPTTPPLGWTVRSYGANPYLAAYAAGGDYASPGGTLGHATHGGGTNDHKDHDLSHNHTPMLAGGSAGAFLEPGDTQYEDTGVKAWTGSDTSTAAKPVTGNLAQHSETDNRPPTTVVVYIKRTALP